MTMVIFNKYCRENYISSYCSYIDFKEITHLFLPIIAKGDSTGVIFKAEVDRDTISSLGGHNSAKLLSVIKACPSSH